MKAVIGVSIPFRGIGHDDLATNICVEARTVLDHRYHLFSVEWQLRWWLEPWVVKVLAMVPSEDYFGWELMGLLLLGASALRT